MAKSMEQRSAAGDRADAEDSKQKQAQSEAEVAEHGQERSDDEPRPLAEGRDDPPRPRR